MTPDATPRRIGNRRGFGSDLREEILAGAERLLALSGPRNAVTLRAIAREAGIAAPSIYPHFRDRDAILDAVVARTFVALADTCRRAAVTAPRGVERIAAISLAYLAFARHNPGQYHILFERSTANIASPPHQYVEGIDAFGLLTSAFEDIAAEGAPRDLDSTLAAQSLFVALHGIATLTPALPGFPWLAESELVRNVIAKMVGPAQEVGRQPNFLRDDPVEAG
ncbi:AcrR family transcriptional regulator [Nakamurella sp. UYEF19]|uniref:TetR/AcrR family transcriptional regulator n=1 Tax=Nakamurella sp. UYEF19 TaxID=1756392 RepID=UPI00339415A9